jgi:hypothetical protein
MDAAAEMTTYPIHLTVRKNSKVFAYKIEIWNQFDLVFNACNVFSLCAQITPPLLTVLFSGIFAIFFHFYPISSAKRAFLCCAVCWVICTSSSEILFKPNLFSSLLIQTVSLGIQGKSGFQMVDFSQNLISYYQTI